MLFSIIAYGVFYLAVIATAVYFIFTWVNRYFNLKKEQNDLLRQIIHKIDKNPFA
ncbi:hypothetical protein SAMN04488057_12064 [Cyclobacterium lianum]|uniref:Uncharacterized protein n=1 Tax=Cyclobacterium lianum TaxID=388280 RepID=A0A1M7QMQ7_9BACT|nr:hypothetical protein [Cyclobacterium lianum]SHN32554.1 hypothetical protein SAMN04488057_12064 [Cyclobacterium lianum]